MSPNLPVERDRPKAALWGSLRGFAAAAAPHLRRYAFYPRTPPLRRRPTRLHRFSLARALRMECTK
jgi:hypothetical protein